MRKGMKPSEVKTSLTFEEKVTAAWAYHVKGIDQHTLASIYSVNPGRISEACTSVEKALADEKSIRTRVDVRADNEGAPDLPARRDGSGSSRHATNEIE